jgi:hypothetical protein
MKNLIRACVVLAGLWLVIWYWMFVSTSWASFEAMIYVDMVLSIALTVLSIKAVTKYFRKK